MGLICIASGLGICLWGLTFTREGRIFQLRSQITLLNSGAEDKTFRMKINNWELGNTETIINFIRKMPDAYLNEPDFVKAWRFIGEYVKYAEPYTGEIWQHSPSLMLNSIGYGHCDDFAEMLAIFWHYLGYNSRVWWLSGHVVSEVFAGGSWMLYDAGYGEDCVFYYKTDGKIAGVEDLTSNSSLITNPINPILNKDNQVYSHNAGQIYNSTENNVFGNFVAPSPIDPNPLFQLPAGARMTLSNNLLTISLPLGWSGIIAEPLLITSITGNLVAIDSLPTNLSTATAMLATRTQYLHELQFNASTQNVIISYQINPRILSPIFSLTLFGKNLETLIETF